MEAESDDVDGMVTHEEKRKEWDEMIGERLEKDVKQTITLLKGIGRERATIVGQEEIIEIGECHRKSDPL